MKNNYSEIVISIVFIFLLLLFFDPLMVLMPTSVVYMALVGLIVVFGAFAGFMWKSRARDERENLHKLIAARLGYLTGMAAMLFAVAFQTVVTHHPDPWLVGAVGVMVLGKLFGYLYGRSKY